MFIELSAGNILLAAGGAKPIRSEKSLKLIKQYSLGTANAHDKLKCVGHSRLRNLWCLPATASTRKEEFPRAGSNRLLLGYQSEG